MIYTYSTLIDSVSSTLIILKIVENDIILTQDNVFYSKEEFATELKARKKYKEIKKKIKKHCYTKDSYKLKDILNG